MSQYSIRYGIRSGRFILRREERCSTLGDALERAESVARIEGCPVRIVCRDRRGVLREVTAVP